MIINIIIIRNSWIREITTGMRENGVKNIVWIDRKMEKKKLNFRQM